MKFSRFTALFLFIFSSLTGFFVQPSSAYAEGCTLGLMLNHMILVKNEFPVSRGIELYGRYLGRDFWNDIRALPREAHWVDAGAGNANAIWEAVHKTEFEIKVRNITAVGVEKGPWAASHIPDTNYKYLDKRYIEDIPAHEIGTADLITDFNGPMAYTAQIDQVLRKYLEVLKKDGKAYIFFRPAGITVDGQADGLGKYLNSIQGAKVDWVLQGIQGSYTIRLTKTSDHFVVPPLYLDRFVAGSKFGWRFDPDRWYHR